MSPEEKTIQVRLKSIRHEAENICAYEFVALDSGTLPPFTAGAHIEIDVGNGMTRCYSLSNAPHDTSRYVIAVALDANGKGGSRYLHAHARVGEIYRVSLPRNNFPLADDGMKSILIAGGIGVTPIWSMAKHLEFTGKPWKVYYRARSQEYAALLDDPFLARLPDKINVVYDADLAMHGVPLAEYLPNLVSKEGERCHYYCCGPTGMLDNFKHATRHLPPELVHWEHFSGTADKAQEGGFDLILAKSKLTIKIPAGKTILDSLLEAGVPVTNSCREGFCGACEVRVIDGTPDHRDSILNDSEKAAGKTMFVCCSGALSSSLTLEL